MICSQFLLLTRSYNDRSLVNHSSLSPAGSSSRKSSPVGSCHTTPEPVPVMTINSDIIHHIVQELLFLLSTLCRHEVGRRFISKRLSVLMLYNAILLGGAKAGKDRATRDSKSLQAIQVAAAATSKSTTTVTTADIITHYSSTVLLATIQFYVSCHHQGIRKNIPMYFLLPIFRFCIDVIVLNVNEDRENQSQKSQSQALEQPEGLVVAEGVRSVATSYSSVCFNTDLVYVNSILSILSRAVDFSSDDFAPLFTTGWNYLMKHVVSDCSQVNTDKLYYINILCLLCGKRQKCWQSPMPIFEDLTDAATFAVDDLITSRSVRLSVMTADTLVSDLLHDSPSSSFLKEIRNVRLETDLYNHLLNFNGFPTNRNAGIIADFCAQWRSYPMEMLARKIFYISCVVRNIGASTELEVLINLSSLCMVYMELMTSAKFDIRAIPGLVEECLHTVTCLIDTHMTTVMAADLFAATGSTKHVVAPPVHSALVGGNSSRQSIVSRDGDAPESALNYRSTEVAYLSMRAEAVEICVGEGTSCGNTSNNNMVLFEKDAKAMETDVISVVGGIAIRLIQDTVSANPNSTGKDGVYNETLLHTCISTLTTLAPWSKQVRRQSVLALPAINRVVFRQCHSEAMLFPMIRLCTTLIDTFHKLESQGDAVIVGLLVNGLWSNNIDVRMVACEFISLISALNPTVVHRCVSRREVEEPILSFLVEEMQHVDRGGRVLDLLRALAACSKDVNHKPSWMNESWCFHWSIRQRRMLDADVVVPIITELLERHEEFGAHATPVFALTIGLSAGLMKNCVAMPQLSKLKNALIKAIIPVLPVSLELLVRSDNKDGTKSTNAYLSVNKARKSLSTEELASYNKRRAMMSSLELLAAHTVHALQAFLCMPDEMFPMAIYLQNVEYFSCTPLCACICFTMTRFRDNVNIQRNCLEIVRCFVDNKLELTALGMHCPSAIMLAIRALPEERRQQCSFCHIVTTIAARDEFARDNLIRFKVYEGLAYVIRGQQMDALPLACQAIVELCDSPDHANAVFNGLATDPALQLSSSYVSTPDRPISSSKQPLVSFHSLVSNPSGGNTMLDLLFQLLDDKAGELKIQMEALQAIIALCVSKDCAMILEKSIKHKQVLKNSRMFLINFIKADKYSADYSKEKITEVVNASSPASLKNEKCVVM